jgi:hypothetical protein
MFNTPILFIVFNRPEITKRVFQAIREIKPKQLFVAADGPRSDRPEEKEMTEEVRRIVSTVDWECELHTLFRTENLGCGLGPKTAIDWFFENVEMGIILEDDCLPDSSFFSFCEECLNFYSYDDDVFHISGLNLLNGKIRLNTSYYISRVPHAWGWATWRRAWKFYTADLQFVDKLNIMSHEKYWIEIFNELIISRDESIWDYQWVYTLLLYNKYSVTPAKNLVINIGFDQFATHTKVLPDWFIGIKKGHIGEISHPIEKHLNILADKAVIQKFAGDLNLFQKIFFRILRLKKRIHKYI